MIEVDLREAEGHLEQLIEEAFAGEEVVIASASGSSRKAAQQSSDPIDLLPILLPG